MALHDSLFHMKNVVAKRPFLTVSDQVRLKLGCILYFGIRVIMHIAENEGRANNYVLHIFAKQLFQSQ